MYAVRSVQTVYHDASAAHIKRNITQCDEKMGYKPFKHEAVHHT